MSTDVYKTYYMGSAGHMFYLTPGAYEPQHQMGDHDDLQRRTRLGFLGGRING